ncbi:hypothetical protein QFC21_001563 [Naganishia friedmannii]|uniref:Uncharacterized protein n=1 Tax=Naganishia friedmannii TaxID=89922 RepID=A0ACC2W460_9TREE|nr:hypothetical protein QFC21_001563 [Naganishia friedmannii]
MTAQSSTAVSPALTAFDPTTSHSSSAATTVPSSPTDDKSNPFTFLTPAALPDIADSDEESLRELERRVREGQGRAVETWGHRGASAAFREYFFAFACTYLLKLIHVTHYVAENTLASFAKACQDGADGIETDIHMTADDRLVMFHDPELSRTTDGEGKIHELPWEGVIENVRTLEAPHQPVPLLSEVLALLMRPENIHVKLNIDCKVENDPVRLFPMIKAELEKFDHWQTLLAPRIILGVWHSAYASLHPEQPKFIEPAQQHLPFLPRYAICMSIPTVREYFFTSCHGFSMYFPTLISAEGVAFRAECARRGKKVAVWTVNKEEEMKECLRWGVQAVITDNPDITVGLVDKVKQDPTALLSSYLQQLVLPWSSIKYYSLSHAYEAKLERDYLEREGGTFDDVAITERS